MFSALTQGSLIYVLDKTDKPKFKIGQIVSISEPKSSFNPQQYIGNYQQTTVDIKVSVDGSEQSYSNIPSSLSMITYNNGKVTLSETKQGLQQEVENILQNSKQVLENIDKYKENIQECESILKQLNPQFAKDKERDDRLDNLEERFGGVESKLDKIINLIGK